MNERQSYIHLVIAVIFWTTVAILGRIVPHLPNATPLTSLSLLAGVLLTRPKALGVTLFCLLVSDSLLAHLYHYPVLGSWTIFTYSGFVFVVLIGANLSAQSPLRFYLITIGLVSIAYWLWTNLGVWLLSGIYLHSMNGLFICYAAALPFLRNALCGDLVWMSTLFCLMRLALFDKLIQCHSRHCNNEQL